MRKRLIYAATHAWNSPIRVGSHHIAHHLSSNYDVLYLSHPVSLSSLLSRKDNQLKERLSLLRSGISAKYTPAHIREMSWFMPFAPGPSIVQKTHFCVNHGYKICIPNPKSTLRRLGYFAPDLLWLDSLFQSFWFKLLQPKKLCVRVADHPTHITTLSPSLRNAFYDVLEQANTIITPSEVIADYLRGITSNNIQVVPNGVEVAHFKQTRPSPKAYLGDTQPKVVYIGAIAEWIDMKLIFAIADLHPELSFYLIGPNHNQDLRVLPRNVHYLGSQPYAEIPAYLQHADIAIAPFDVAHFPEFIESIDAIKLYEYLASGTPTVATRWSQSLALQPHVTIAEQNASMFGDKLVEIIEHPEKNRVSEEIIAEIDWSARLSALDAD